MKRISPYIALAFMVACGGSQEANKAPSSSPSPSGPAAAVATRSYPAVGVVMAINPGAPSIEIKHEDIEGLMPAMQMEFDVSDGALLTGLAVNDQIDFTVEDRTGIMRVTAIKKK